MAILLLCIYIGTVCPEFDIDGDGTITTEVSFQLSPQPASLPHLT